MSEAVRIPVPGSASGTGWELAGSIFLPPEGSPRPCPLLVLLPGGGYARGYFDLPVPGFSQAEHHAAAGCAVLTLDHLGVGESSLPDREASTLEAVAAATDAAVQWTRAHVGVPVGAVVAAGQSLGGHIAAATQALHRTFEGIALLGSSVAGSSFPMRPGAPPLAIPEGATGLEAAMAVRNAVDWSWVFHYDPDAAAAVDPSAPPHDLASLVGADIAAGLPAKTLPVPWASTTFPGFVSDLGYARRVAELAAGIDVPVLLATGERDVTHPFEQESAVFAAAPSVTRFTGQRMAHMHNFSEYRADLWRALDRFASGVLSRS